MTRKDYERVATILKMAKHEDCEGLSRAQWIENELAKLFATDNARFNPERFHANSGVE